MAHHLNKWLKIIYIIVTAIVAIGMVGLSFF